MPHDAKSISTWFLILLLAISTYFAYVIFKPFLTVIVLAGVFASLLYPVYKWFRAKLKGRESLAALVTVVVFVLVILLPIANFIILLAHESSTTYTVLQEKMTSGEFNDVYSRTLESLRSFQANYFSFIDLASFDIKKFVLDLGGQLNKFVIAAGASFILGTTQLLTNIFFLLLTMFFLLRDGRAFVERVSALTPLSNRYDQKLFDKFREVSRVTILSSLVTAVVQAGLGMIAFAIIGFPVLFLGAATFMAALIPVIGTALVMVPCLIVLAIMGKWASFLFLAIWALVVIGGSDNIIRAWIIKGSSQIHPLLVFFSIFGGIAAFGFAGIIFGPLVLAIILTVLHIYELEYQHVLER
ncbi:MAG: AI-2E family transporter [Parcubacteria group bacterium]|nr:AI-2E family transporter [Parcubacteria group bacterium]